MARMIRLKNEERSPIKLNRRVGRVAQCKPAGKRESGANNENPLGGSNGEYYEPAARMQPPSFVKQYRRRIQGFLWNKAEKQGVADYLKMMDAERETTKRSAQKRPKEVRVLWVHEDATQQ